MSPDERTTMEFGIQKAFARAVERAVRRLSQRGGFQGDEMVRIALPPWLQRFAGVLRRTGGRPLVERFETALNRAAERAMPEAAGTLARTVSSMGVREIRDVARGSQDAATRYLREQTSDELYRRLRPIVEEEVERWAVIRWYKRAAPRVLGEARGDIDDYVTRKAVEGVFAYIAVEERKLRERPFGRAGQLLRHAICRG